MNNSNQTNKVAANGLQTYLINLNIELFYAPEMKPHGAYYLANYSMSSSPSIQELPGLDAIMDLSIWVSSAAPTGAHVDPHPLLAGWEFFTTLGYE